MSAAKRALAADNNDDDNGSTSVKAARIGAETVVSVSESRMPVVHQLAQALRTGVLSFLSIRDTAMLLNCCKEFWQDNELAELALWAEPAWGFVQHLGTKCSFDWFWLTPRRTATGYDDNKSRDCNHKHTRRDEAKRRAGGFCDDMPNAFANPVLDARLLSAMAAVTEFILPVCPGFDMCVTDFYYSIFVVPVMIPLRSYHPDAANLAIFHDWSREDVRVTLNTLREGFGDHFVDDNPARAFVSQFGLHWDNMHLLPESGKVECSFCSVTQYKQQRDAANNKYMISESCGASAMAELRASELGQRFAVCERLFQAADHDGDDEDWEVKYCELLRATGLTVFPCSNGGNFREYDVRVASDIDGGYPDLCTTFAQPLKQLLLRCCKFTRRMEYKCCSGEDDPCDGEMISEVVTELLAGVTPSGYLCGVYLVRNNG